MVYACHASRSIITGAGAWVLYEGTGKPEMNAIPVCIHMDFGTADGQRHELGAWHSRRNSRSKPL